MMFIAPFLSDIDVHHITYKEFMAAITRMKVRGVHLVAVPHVLAFIATTHKNGNRTGGTVALSAIQKPVLGLVNQPSRDVSPMGRAVGTQENGR